MNEEPSFGAIVRERRKALGLTQTELARRVGCAPVTIRKIEYGALRPSVQISEHLAVALNIPEEEHLAFVRLARREPEVSPIPTPPPALEEIGLEDLSGRAIKGFELAERIGAGGYGAVYRAMQATVERDVAIKIILPKYADRPEFIRRFEAEAQLVARLEHPHIVPLYDYWREPGVAYLVMRFLRGGNLAARLKAGPLASETVLNVLEQICAGLYAAHRAGVIHRDIKPANVLLDEDGNAYLADFGIAKNLSALNGGGQTSGEMVIGSPAYISPEQILAEPVKPQTDIYSLGVMLYELLTGRKPFKGPTPVAYIQQHLNEQLPLLAAAPKPSKVSKTFEGSPQPAIPTPLDIAIGRATSKNPQERYPDILSMLADLRQALNPDSTVADVTHNRPDSITPLHIAAMIELPDLENPYKGLRPFTESDAGNFFGRDTLVQALLIRMAEESDLSRFLAVVGPSGSGKSSVVKAGLMPALRQGGLPGSEKWFLVEMTPGTHPLEELETALLRVAVNPPDSLLSQLRQDERGLLRAVRRILPADEDVELVLIIDQFEEIFTLVEDEQVRAHLLESLVTAVLDPHSRLRVVITVRADFTDRPLQYVDFGELVRQQTEFVLPLTPDELELAITGPTKRAGLSLEPGLVTTIIGDIGDQPGMLPLLQYALTELFERRDGRKLTLAAYQDSGGVLGALARRAEELYTALDEAGQEAARQLFLRLVTLGEGTEDTRRRVFRSELAAIQPPSNSPQRGEDDLTSPPLGGTEGGLNLVINQFGKYRLLTFDHDPVTRGPTVEVAHEALLREWDRLRQWLNESREDIRQERAVARAADEWDRHQREVSFLLRGVRLEQIETWQETTTLIQTPLEQEFIAHSLQQREREHQAETARKAREAQLEQRSRNFLRGLVAVFAVAAIISAGLGLFAFQQRHVALDNAAEAQNVALVAGSQAALANDDTDTALALAWQAVSLNPDLALAQAQLSDVAYTPGTVRRFVGHTDRVGHLAISPDGRTVLSGSDDKTVMLWDLETGEILWQREDHPSPVYDVAFSPDGLIAASVSAEMAILWDVESGQIIRQFDGHEEDIDEIAFSPDGQRLVTGGWGDASELIHWDVESGEMIQRFEINTQVIEIEFTPDGSAILYGGFDDGRLRLMDTHSGQIIHEMTPELEIEAGGLFGVAISPDGRTALAGFQNSVMFLWDLSSGTLIRRYPVDGGAFGVAFHPEDNGLAFVGGSTGILRTLDLKTGEILNTFTGHSGTIEEAAILPNGRHAVSASHDKTLRLWELDRGQVIRQFDAPSELAFEVDLSPDGRTALSGSNDGTVTLWDVETSEMIRRFTADQPVMAVTYSPDGQTALIGTGYRFAEKIEPGKIILWDVETGEEIRRFVGHPYVVYDVEFSPDGKQAVSSGNGAVAIVWDVETGQEIRRFEDYFVDSPYPNESFWSVSFSADGRTVLAAYNKGPVIVWDVETGEEIGQLVGHDVGAAGITFSADGQRVVSGGWDGQAILWDMQTGRIIRRFTNHTGSVGQVQFTPDERLMLGGSADGTNSLWDVETGEGIRRYGQGFVIKPVFNADGSQALVGFHDGTMELWRMDTTLDELLQWTQANRYIPDLTCEQRELYRIEPLCESGE